MEILEAFGIKILGGFGDRYFWDLRIEILRVVVARIFEGMWG